MSWELIDLAFCHTHCSSLFLCQYAPDICWLLMQPPLASTAGDRRKWSPRPSSFVQLLTNGSAQVVTSDTHTHSSSFHFRRYLLILSFSCTPLPNLTLFLTHTRLSLPPLTHSFFFLHGRASIKQWFCMTEQPSAQLLLLPKTHTFTLKEHYNPRIWQQLFLGDVLPCL